MVNSLSPSEIGRIGKIGINPRDHLLVANASDGQRGNHSKHIHRKTFLLHTATAQVELGYDNGQFLVCLICWRVGTCMLWVCVIDMLFWTWCKAYVCMFVYIWAVFICIVLWLCPEEGRRLLLLKARLLFSRRPQNNVFVTASSFDWGLR